MNKYLISIPAMIVLAANIAIAAPAMQNDVLNVKQAADESMKPLNVKALPVKLAKIMGEAAEKKAVELNIKISVSILDNHGNLKYFSRMDGATSGSIEISKLKASTSAKLPLSSREVADLNEKNTNQSYNHFPFVITLPGGLPIKTADGEHIGSIGISGASADQDEQCAQAGLDAIQESLK